MKVRNFLNDLRESSSFKKELNILRVAIDVFGHLPVVGCLPDEDVCQILIQGNCAFCSFYKTDPTTKCNFVAG